MVKAVRQQKVLLELYPQAAASRCIYELAHKVSAYQPNTSSRGAIRFFWHHLLENPEVLPLELSKM